MVEIKREQQPNNYEVIYRDIKSEIGEYENYSAGNNIEEQIQRCSSIEKEIKPKIEPIEQERKLVIKLDRKFLKKNYRPQWIELVKSTFRRPCVKKACQLCKTVVLVFEDASKLIEHYKESHGNEVLSYHCTLCDYSSDKQQHTIDHWNNEHVSLSQIIEKFKVMKKPNDPNNIWIGDDKLVRSFFPKKKSDKKPKEVECDVCSKKMSRYSLKTHMLVHSDEKNYECDICQKRCRFKSAIVTHMIVHLKDKRFKCDLCPKSFSVRNYLEKHKYVHLKDVLPDSDPRVKQRKADLELIECEICHVKITRRSMHLHKRTHSKDMAYKCKVCNKSFRRNSSLRLHSYTHLDKKPFPCTHSPCSKSFATNRQLEHHELTHLKGILPDDDPRWKWRDYKKKVIECEICSKKINHYSLKHHMRIHNNEKPYKCDVCDKSFRLKTNLRLHQAIHTNKKRLNCSFWGAKYLHKSYLKVHERQHREGKPKYQFCSKEFANFAFVTRHVRTEHFHLLRQEDKLNGGLNKLFQGMQTFECYKCNFTHISSTVKKHIESCQVGESFIQCSKCTRKLSDQGALIKHMNIH